MPRRMPPHRSLDRQRTFKDIFDEHLIRGTRPLVRQATQWTNKEFAGRLGVDERTVRNWRAGRSLPPELGPIERELFGDNESYAALRNELRDTHQQARRYTAGEKGTTLADDLQPFRNYNPAVAIHFHRKSAIVFSKSRAHYINKIKATVIGDILEYYNVRYRWAGDGEISIQVNSPQAEAAPVRLGGTLDDLWRLSFSKRYERGDEIELEFVLRAESLSKHDKPYYGTFVDGDTPTDCELILEAHFASGSNVKNVWTEEYYPAYDILPVEHSEKCPVPQSGDWVWPLSWKPYHRYCICWEFDP